jgi:hypothetical protein
MVMVFARTRPERRKEREEGKAFLRISDGMERSTGATGAHRPRHDWIGFDWMEFDGMGWESWTNRFGARSTDDDGMAMLCYTMLMRRRRRRSYGSYGNTTYVDCFLLFLLSFPLESSIIKIE